MIMKWTKYTNNNLKMKIKIVLMIIILITITIIIIQNNNDKEQSVTEKKRKERDWERTIIYFHKDSYRLLENSCLSSYCGDISKIGMKYCKVNCS